MSKHIESYCDLCAQLLYHSVSSTEVKAGKNRFWWHGDYDRESDYEICGDCDDVIRYIVSERKDLVKKIRAKLYGKSPTDQMENKPKPLTKQWVIRFLTLQTHFRKKG